MSHLAARLLYWSPRSLAIAFALFVSIFALDVFGEAHGFWPTAVALGIHLIPVAVLAGVLAAAWRWEWVGAVVFSLIAGFYAWQVLPRHMDWAAIMGTPLVLIAALFLANWIESAEVRSAL